MALSNRRPASNAAGRFYEVLKIIKEWRNFVRNLLTPLSESRGSIIKHLKVPFCLRMEALRSLHVLQATGLQDGTTGFVR